MTQEDLAEKMGVSRQTIAKWENGESVPNVVKCNELAEIFDIELQSVASLFLNLKDQDSFKPKDKYIFEKCIVKDSKIIIPDEAMAIFNIKNGDELIMVGDIKQGIALFPAAVSDFMFFILHINNHPKSNNNHFTTFNSNIHRKSFFHNPITV